VAKPLTLAGSNDEFLAAWSLRPGVELDHSFAFDDAPDAGHGFWPSDDLAAFEFADNRPAGGAEAGVSDIYPSASRAAEAVQAAPSDAVLSTLGPADHALAGDTLVFKPLAAPDPSHPAAPQASIAPEFVLNPAGELVHAASVLDGLAVALPPPMGLRIRRPAISPRNCRISSRRHRSIPPSRTGPRASSRRRPKLPLCRLSPGPTSPRSNFSNSDCCTDERSSPKFRQILHKQNARHLCRAFLVELRAAERPRAYIVPKR